MDNSATTDYARQGTAVISNIEITSQIDDYVKVNISFEGASALASTTLTTITPASASRAKIRGKALMVAVNLGTAGTPSWHTIACATNHTLTISNQIGDVRCKDVNDKAPAKEVTGHSCKLTSENLIAFEEGTVDAAYIANLDSLIRDADSVMLQFGYYPDSIGNEESDWGASDTLIVSGTFLCTNLSINANGTQEDATFKTEFSSKGEITVGS
jgi:predicted secreted protein